jgi:hypothetical protein
MTYAPNPYHDPDWAAKAAAAAENCRRWEAVCAAIAAAEGFASARHLAALEQHREAIAQHRIARLGQFATIAAYAEARFAALPAATGFSVTAGADSFTTIEAVDEAFLRAAQRRRRAEYEDTALLPDGQPPGLAAFGDPAAVISSWRRFEGVEPGETLDCMVSFHQAQKQFHVCLAHRWGGLSARSNETFRRIAAILTRQTICFAMPEAEIIFRDGNHRLAEHRALIRQVNEMARRFSFYRHLWPDHALKEQFSRVEMVWDGAGFIDPDWSADIYALLPVALRQASQNFADSGPGAPLALLTGPG